MIIIASILFIITPILSIPIQLIGLFSEKKNNRLYGFYLSVIIGIIGMNIIPNENMDLFRYYGMMNQIKSYDLQMIKDNLLLASEPLMNMIFYFFGKFDIKEYIVLATSIVYYNTLFYMFFDYCKIKKINNTNKIIFFLFMMINIMIIPTITGIRFALGTIIFVLAIYREYIKEDKNIFTYFLYAISGLIHASMFVFLGFRILMIFNKEKISKITLVGMIVLSLLPSLLTPILKSLASISFLEALVTRIGYLSMDFKVSNLNLLLSLINLIQGIIIINFYIKNKEDKILQIATMLCIPGIILIFGETVSGRIFNIITILFVFILINKYKENKEFKINLVAILLVMLCVIKLRSQFMMFKNSGGMELFFDEKVHKNVISLIFEGNEYL